MSLTSKNRWLKAIAMVLVVTFTATGIPVQGAFAQVDLPEPGTMVHLSSQFQAPMITGIKVDPNNPLLFNFLIDPGDLVLSPDQQKVECRKLIKYFLAALTTPEKDMWVNLSPYEHNRMVSNDLGATEMGRDMLAQDYILKQLTASLIYPQATLGKKFWDEVYERVRMETGSANVPVSTFNKVWIIPDSATVFEKGNVAIVVKSHMKVMLDEDYLSLQKHQGQSSHSIASQIVRQVIVPAIEKEVNEGRNFANIRQIYNSMILAAWFKQNLRTHLLNHIYVNKNESAGVKQDDPQDNERIYQAYLKAFKKGAFNYIKEDTDTVSGQVVPRKYFSGGENYVGLNRTENTPGAVLETTSDPAQLAGFGRKIMLTAAVSLSLFTASNALAGNGAVSRMTPHNDSLSPIRVVNSDVHGATLLQTHVVQIEHQAQVKHSSPKVSEWPAPYPWSHPMGVSTLAPSTVVKASTTVSSTVASTGHKYLAPTLSSKTPTLSVDRISSVYEKAIEQGYLNALKAGTNQFVPLGSPKSIPLSNDVVSVQRGVVYHFTNVKFNGSSSLQSFDAKVSGYSFIKVHNGNSISNELRVMLEAPIKDKKTNQIPIDITSPDQMSSAGSSPPPPKHLGVKTVEKAAGGVVVTAALIGVLGSVKKRKKKGGPPVPFKLTPPEPKLKLHPLGIEAKVFPDRIMPVRYRFDNGLSNLGSTINGNRQTTAPVHNGDNKGEPKKSTVKTNGEQPKVAVNGSSKINGEQAATAPIHNGNGNGASKKPAQQAPKLKIIKQYDFSGESNEELGKLAVQSEQNLIDIREAYSREIARDLHIYNSRDPLFTEKELGIMEEIHGLLKKQDSILDNDLTLSTFGTLLKRMKDIADLKKMLEKQEVKIEEETETAATSANTEAKAAASAAMVTRDGGIDFDSKYLQMNIQGDSAQITVPKGFEWLLKTPISGFNPQILNIRSGIGTELSFFDGILTK